MRRLSLEVIDLTSEPQIVNEEAIAVLHDNAEDGSVIVILDEDLPDNRPIEIEDEEEAIDIVDLCDEESEGRSDCMSDEIM